MADADKKLKNKERLRLWHIANRTRRLADRKARHQANRDIENLNSKKWQQANREKTRAYQKKFRSKPEYREYNRQRCAAWKEANRERFNEICRRSREKHKDQIHERQNRAYQKNPELWKFHARKRRALEQKAEVNIAGIKSWMAGVKASRNFTCYYCQQDFPTSKVHFDHVIALSKGGPHSVENLCASCPSCNLSKGAKPIRVWIKTGQQLLEI